MERYLIQTFWTKPFINSSKFSHILEVFLKCCAISLTYAHNSGYKIRMYTDTIGYAYLKDLGYDELNTQLDNIPNNINPLFFAYAKIYALEHEVNPIVHTDFDVFIKLDCLKKFYENDDYDIIVLNIELINAGGYINSKKNLLEVWTHNVFDPDTNFSVNCGIIGFNNNTLKNNYIENYKKLATEYSTYDLSNYNWGNCTPDLHIELLNLGSFLKDYQFLCLLPIDKLNFDYSEMSRVADQIGYCHLLGSWKYSDDGLQAITKRLKELNKDLYNIILYKLGQQ